MKICAKCLLSKTIESFGKRAKSKDGRQSWCRLCSNTARMDAYYKDPKKNRKTEKARIIRNRIFVRDILEGCSCSDCPEKDYRALQFDHVRGTKITDVSSMVSFGSSIERIKLEISKCEVRCANCHIKRHRKFIPIVDIMRK